MKIINSAYNAAFARAMAKHNNPELPEEDDNYVRDQATVLPRASMSQRPESKAAIMAGAAYSRRIHDQLNDR